MTNLAHVPTADLHAELSRRVKSTSTPAVCVCPTQHDCHSGHVGALGRDVEPPANGDTFPARRPA